MELATKTTKTIRRKPKLDVPRPACRLSAKALAIRKRVLTEWVLSDSEIILLDRCLTYSDECDKYAEILDREGLSILNSKTGASRPNPALPALKLARANYLTAWRMLDLVPEKGKAAPGRPLSVYPDRR
jgi:hypothetical protein